jgi:hypothetical protein
MHPNLVKGIRQYSQKHELGDIEAGILMCCETISEKKHKGFFASLVSTDPDPVHHTGMLATPTWLIWARSGVKYGTVVSSARLKDIQVKDFSSDLVEDTGMDVFGFLGDSAERVTAFIGLGPEPAAQIFRETVQHAITKVTKG